MNWRRKIKGGKLTKKSPVTKQMTVRCVIHCFQGVSVLCSLTWELAKTTLGATESVCV